MHMSFLWADVVWVVCIMNVKGWTAPRYWQWVRSGLRKQWQRYPNRYQALSNAKISRGKYECAECQHIFKNKEVVVDHIKACGPLSSYSDLAHFVRRLFCKLGELQVLCKACHYTKTMHERGLTDVDIELIKFKKLRADGQRRKLGRIDIAPVGKNATRRIEQYRQYLEGKK